MWTDTSNNETGFRIERKLGTGQWSQIAVTAADVTGFSSTGLRANTTYSFRVRAANAVGNSPYSNEAKATTFPLPPAPPTGLVATAGNGRVTLTWTASSTAKAYHVFRSTVSGSGYSPLASGLTATSFIDTTVTGNTTYYYVVTAANSGGESAPSAEVSATPAPPLTAPAGLTATAASKSRIDLAWTDTSGTETGFRIERKLGTGKWSQIAVTAANVTRFSSTGLRANSTYSFRVRATNASGNSPYSNEARATTLRQ